ncbi:MAG TPA: ABC transporter ATP-binding protein [Anaerolineae bacterium]|nr:ABC transporter ATP-binding protein [Anaerolineae bacterium]
MIQLEDVSVRYRAPQERVGTFKEYAIRRLQRRVRFNDFLALSGISLEIRRGEIFGIIGRNGAGKSTLLKVISRVLVPTGGRVRLRGRVAPLLELGAGFHPELTGRENIFLNGTLLGHSNRDLRSRLESIVEFAELGGFIDAPLRTYSTGMAARLGFSVATAWQPEVLLLDEVLAVGDTAFQEKCYSRMKAYRKSGTTTIMVSHSMDNVRKLCGRAAWLDHGKIMSIGEAKQVVSDYQARQRASTVR